MPAPKDLYTEFLDIPPGPRPPNHYAILLLRLFEADRVVIHDAVLSQNANLRRWALHPDAKTRDRVQDMLNELGRADFILGDPKTKAEYDRKLAAELGVPLVAPPPLAVQTTLPLPKPPARPHAAARCPACGARMQPGDAFCPSCGAGAAEAGSPLAQLASEIRHAPPWVGFFLLGTLALALLFLDRPWFWAFVALNLLGLPWMILQFAWSHIALSNAGVLAAFLLLSWAMRAVTPPRELVDKGPKPRTATSKVTPKTATGSKVPKASPEPRELPFAYRFPAPVSPALVPFAGPWAQPDAVAASSVRQGTGDLRLAADDNLLTAWVSDEPNDPAVELAFSRPQELDGLALLDGWSVPPGQNWVLHPRIRQVRLLFDGKDAYTPPELPPTPEFWHLIPFDRPRKATRVRLVVLSMAYPYKSQAASHEAVVSEVWCRLAQPGRGPDRPPSAASLSLAGRWRWCNDKPAVFHLDGRAVANDAQQMQLGRWQQDGAGCPYYRGEARPEIEPATAAPPTPPEAPPTVTRVAGGTATVALGRAQGVQPGTILTFELRDRPIRHLGQAIGFEVTELRVDSVDGASCQGRPLLPDDPLPSPGDSVRSMRKR